MPSLGELCNIFILDESLFLLRVCLNIVYFVENWKYYSKIIFKCVNSVVRPIFNESFAEKEVCGSSEQCTGPIRKAWNALLKKKE